MNQKSYPEIKVLLGGKNQRKRRRGRRSRRRRGRRSRRRRGRNNHTDLFTNTCAIFMFKLGGLNRDL